MNLHIRPPQEHEWRICRMLLPETFADAASREYLLCLRQESPRVVAAASFSRQGYAIGNLRVHVVSSFRRHRVGSQVLAYIARNGAHSLAGVAEINKEPGVEAFCEYNRFQRTDALTTVEGDIAEMRDYVRRLRARIVPPAGASVLRLPAAPAEEVANLHAQYVAHEGALNPWRFLVANSPSMNHSPVVMIEGRVAGLLLWEMKDGMAVVRSRVVAPDYQGGWMNTALLGEGLDGAWASGARRVRFSYTDSNRDTQKLATRFRATATSVIAQFERRLKPQHT